MSKQGNDSTVNKWRAAWRRAVLCGNESDWLKSEVGRIVLKEVGEDLLYETLGVIGVPTGSKRMVKDMAYAREVIPERADWLALGWSGVRELVNMNAKERAKRLASMRKKIEKGTKPKQAAKSVLPPKTPKPPKQPKPEPKQAAPTLTATPSKAQEKKHKALAEKHEAMRADLIRLVSFYPYLLPLLSESVRREIESDKRAAS